MNTKMFTSKRSRKYVCFKNKTTEFQRSWDQSRGFGSGNQRGTKLGAASSGVFHLQTHISLGLLFGFSLLHCRYSQLSTQMIRYDGASRSWDGMGGVAPHGRGCARAQSCGPGPHWLGGAPVRPLAITASCLTLSSRHAMVAGPHVTRWLLDRSGAAWVRVPGVETVPRTRRVPRNESG